MATARKNASLHSGNGAQSTGIISNGTVVHKNEKDAQKETAEPSTTTIAATILSPALITTFVLIFGGCCSNVYTLESILALSPATGSLITFLQFLFTSLFTLPTQITSKSSSTSSSSLIPKFRPRKVPLYKWLIYTLLFLAVNILNNTAFNYRISIPLHIILRSAGPVTSMIIGYIFAGRRYETRKIVAVTLLFCGVVLAALSDAASKGKISVAGSSHSSELSKQLPGFILVFSALLISAFMGIYTDELYKEYGRSASVANESLFYSHILSLPIFGAQFKSLYSEYIVMVSNASLQNTVGQNAAKSLYLPSLLQSLGSYVPLHRLISPTLSLKPVLLLLANAFTQIVCITGVQRLSTQTSSLTVSIVLNIRKLASLVLSIWLFGNKLPLGVTIGATLVFLGGGLYGLPSSASKPQAKRQGVRVTKSEKKDR